MINKKMVLLLIFFAVKGFSIEFEFEIEAEGGLPSAIIKAVNEAYDFNMQGIEALQRGELGPAMSYFDEALNILPDYSDALNNRGVVYFRRGNVVGAQETWESLIELDPEYAVAYYNLGLISVHENKYKQALDYFELALRNNNRFVEAMVRMGYVHLKKGEYNTASTFFRRAYEIDPEQQDVWNFYAYSLILDSDTAKAVQVLKGKDHKDALSQLGRIEASRGNYNRAIDHLSKAVARDADESVLVELATVQIEAEKYTDAIATLDSYFSLNVKHCANSFLLAGVAARKSSDLESAMKYLEKGAANYPRDPLIRYNLGQLYHHHGKFDEAETKWQGLSDSLQEPSLYYQRALNARNRDDLTTAEKLVNRAIQMDRRAEYYDLLGVIHHERGDSAKSEQYFREALKIDPNLASAQLNLALRSKSQQEIQESIKQLEQILERCSGEACAEITFQLAIMHYFKRNTDKAITILNSIEEEHKNERVYRHLGIFYREKRELHKAIDVLETAVERFITEARTEYELAETYMMAGFPSKAAATIKNLIPRWRDNPWRLYYQLGYAYLEQNDLVNARKYLERSMNANNRNTAPRSLLAFVLNRMGDIDKARDLWQRNLREDPQNSVLWINMGLSLEKEGRFSEALDHYRRAQMHKPDEYALYINIGNAYAGMEQYTEALEAYSHGLKSDKRDVAAYNIFLIAQRRKEKQRADRMLELLTSEFPSSMHTRRAEAEMKFWMGDTVKALNILEGLDEKDSYDWLALARIYASSQQREKTTAALAQLPSDAQWDRERDFVMASLAFYAGEYRKAHQLFKAIDDTTFSGRYNLALSAYKDEKYEDALSMAEALVAQTDGSDRADVLRLAGNSAFALNRWDEARVWYRQLSRMEMRNPVVLYNLAVANYNLDEIENAHNFYKRARELDMSIENKDIEMRYYLFKNPPDSTQLSGLDSLDILYNEAVALQNAGDDREAEEIYLRIVEIDERYSLAWNNLGALYGARGDLKKAEKAYLKALERRFDNPEIYANLINVYMALEKFSEARRWVMLGLGHNPDNQMLQQLSETIIIEEQKYYER
ncbi:tetratricopeptide repeat protein [Chitinispirillales bacterium ANBcel5]|uniref:tetratricopeptide repeat protein n=1 Tax=Cellulosispirillum alkaliphilum TaxID=3039283 RepID=UPI002A525846|nr:tetratricopeptide repeat protein [Chitinispirillales bacterium ANBcel5]